MSGRHFDQMAGDYVDARPPYPEAVYDTLESAGVIGRGLRVLEVGAGAGLATRELRSRGSDVVALEPGPRLAALIGTVATGVRVLPARLEDAQLDEADFDTAVAATAMHWVDLSVGLPRLHRAVRPGGSLAVWRNVFGDDTVDTPFRRRVAQIVARRAAEADPGRGREQRPTMEELAAGGWFEPVRTERWRWSIELDARQIGLLLRSFSDWTRAEAAAAEAAANDLGGRVTEHYQSVLHLLRRTEVGVADRSRPRRSTPLDVT